jgi:hypothetical protein
MNKTSVPHQVKAANRTHTSHVKKKLLVTVPLTLSVYFLKGDPLEQRVKVSQERGTYMPH